MSSYHQIFVQTGKPEDQLVADIAAAAGCRLRKLDTTDAPIEYTGRTRRVAVEVGLHHNVEDGPGISFSQYPVLITLRSLDSEKPHEEMVAKEVFNKLVDTTHYTMILTFNLCNMLKKYSPAEK